MYKRVVAVLVGVVGIGSLGDAMRATRVVSRIDSIPTVKPSKLPADNGLPEFLGVMQDGYTVQGALEDVGSRSAENVPDDREQAVWLESLLERERMTDGELAPELE